MKFKSTCKRLFLFTPVILLIYLNGCIDILPHSELSDIYVSPRINSYKIERVALLPMAHDDTTDSGTFYSTNHFLNSLKLNYPSMEFIVPSFKKSAENDTLIPSFIESIEKLRRLDLKIFFNSRIGGYIDEENPDAILIGKVDKRTPRAAYFFRYYSFVSVISCEFRYYLISLVDGRVLWKGNILGEEGYYVSRIREQYPPLDLALANGIDEIINTLPFSKNSEQNYKLEK